MARWRTEEGLAARALSETLGLLRYLTGYLVQLAIRMQEHRGAGRFPVPGRLPTPHPLPAARPIRPRTGTGTRIYPRC